MIAAKSPSGFTPPALLLRKSRNNSAQTTAGVRPIRKITLEIIPLIIELLNHYFHTKSVSDVKLACEEEAKQILEGSQEHPAIVHAVTLLKALGENFERHADSSTDVAQLTPSHYLVSQQYCLALRNLTSSMSSSCRSKNTKSTLSCCRVFASIEQVHEEYTVTAQHITHALKIMRSSGARPSLLTAGDFCLRTMPGYH